MDWIKYTRTIVGDLVQINKQFSVANEPQGKNRGFVV